MGNLNASLPVIVTYRKRKNGKVYLQKFENTRVDDVINGRKRKPLIPDNYEILDIGVGESFEERYKQKYKL